MTIADKLTEISNAKQAIVSAVQDKGGTLADKPHIADIAPAIEELSLGGAVGVIATGDVLDLHIDAIDFAGKTGTMRNFLAFGSSVKELTNTENITVIGASSFAYCSSLTSVNFPSVTSIGSSSFSSCTSLTSANFPSVTSIGDQSFYGCSSLESVFIGGESPVVPILDGKKVFTGTSNSMSIVVPDALVEEYKTASNWSLVASKIIGITEWSESQ